MSYLIQGSSWTVDVAEHAMEQDRAASIQTRAYQLWEEGGREDGNHERHWRQAELDIDAAASTATADPAVRDEQGQTDEPRLVPSPIVQP